ncbi:MAG: hypothetical protein WCV99_10535 [Sterolibacterium sp.]
MIVYLDQNKWIELARIVHGKDKSQRAKGILHALNAAIQSGCIIPLSAMHYMETARISNVARRARLGSVMWKYSKGNTLASYPSVVRYEIEIALSKHFSEVKPSSNIKLLGQGISHAFGENRTSNFPPEIEEEIERSMLTGNSGLKVDPLSFRNSAQRENFCAHLGSLHKTKEDLPKSKWENWLYAMAMVDIINPLAEVMYRYNIEKSDFENLGEAQLKAFVDEMPTRHLDLHLHRQVLRNPSYNPKITDLEDWAGLGIASCYCDIVVCEKHMADMIQRDHFSVKARIETNLANIFQTIQT